jgi:hypothetical protein
VQQRRWINRSVIGGIVKLYTKGSRVSQASYGPGTVTSSDERYTVIDRGP